MPPSSTFIVFLVGLTLSAAAQLQTTVTSGDQESTYFHRLPALIVLQGTPPAPGISPGSFTSVTEGQLLIPKRYRLFFSLEGTGSASLMINGKELLSGEILPGKESPRLRLNPGQHHLKLVYSSPKSGKAHFRLHWRERRAFPTEPVPTSAFSPFRHERSPQGRTQLIASHHCLKCHQAGELGPHRLPELAHRPPSLENLASRRHGDWLIRWIASPSHLNPTTTMPAMVDHRTPEGAQAAADIAAYLGTLGSAPEADVIQSPEQALAGGVHFQQLGCIACHTLPDQNEPDAHRQRIPLNNVHAKFAGKSLTAFLLNPAEYHSHTKMPDFGLNPSEAAELSAFLHQESKGHHTPDPAEFPPGSVVEGEKQIRALNCAACHDELPASDPLISSPAFQDLRNWDQGCTGPEMNLTSEKRKVLFSPTEDREKDRLSGLIRELRFDHPAALARRQVAALRCQACHQYDGVASDLSVHGAEADSLLSHLGSQATKASAALPPLTHAGAMLHTSFLEEMLSSHRKVRPWIRMRMPVFPAFGKDLAYGLSAQHGLAGSVPETGGGDVQTGKTLVGMEGYACTTCHAVGAQPALAAFEVQGINFALTPHRLREGYYYQWMHDPQRLQPGTKMPRYTNPDGSALRPEILDGDSRAQFRAIWAYFESLRQDQ